ncbi:hypothetical protein [Polynucleobacter sp. AP-Nickl1-40-C4]|jgi:hypothetical protein|uniref:hypothetical protein n=1 Tax=Polynucleobacter sp. AP-Nickl1-40-C4 TaxID=3108275 RepID=UPI002B223666|nr:hypothetical protein [Polynucleobacter sp. AP-Nickl1-40-C4]MEA9568972.1 hypothetical protein [Polynucleobacter sp. AP-Nickl1-40-C4]
MLILQTQHITVKTKYLVNNNGTLMFQRRIPLGLRKYFQNKQHIRLKLTPELTGRRLMLRRYLRSMVCAPGMGI